MAELGGDGNIYTLIDTNANTPQRYYRIVSP